MNVKIIIVNVKIIKIIVFVMKTCHSNNYYIAQLFLRTHLASTKCFNPRARESARFECADSSAPIKIRGLAKWVLKILVLSRDIQATCILKSCHVYIYNRFDQFQKPDRPGFFTNLHFSVCVEQNG